MAQVTIYTRPFCGFCARALALLADKGAQVNEIEAGFDPAKRAEMVARSGGATFPSDIHRRSSRGRLRRPRGARSARRTRRPAERVTIEVSLIQLRTPASQAAGVAPGRTAGSRGGLARRPD